MNEEVSKNIIIILLIIFVVGLLGVIYFQESRSSNADLSGEMSVNGEVVGEIEIIGEVDFKNEDVKPKESSGAQPQTSTIVKSSNAVVSDKSISEGVTIITYKDTGFIPSVVEVRAGNSITFINSSTKPLWVTSSSGGNEDAAVYPGFDQGKSISNGGTYTFTFTKTGVWGYKNLNQNKHLGVVLVIPQ
jgi:plastocyanin